MKNIQSLTIAILIGVIYFMAQKSCNQKPIEKTITIEKTLPAIQGRSDTLYMDSLIYLTKTLPRETDTLLIKYLQDSLNRLNMFIQAIAIREYSQKYTDTVQQVEVYSKTRGELIEQSISYTIFPQTIKFDTTIIVDNPSRNMYFGSLGVRTGQFGTSVLLKGTFINKKHRIASFDIGTDGQLSVSYGIKF
jgi:hypothetical protein